MRASTAGLCWEGCRPRCLVGRVDALVVAVKVELSERARDEAARRQAVANEAGNADLRLGELTFALRRSRRVDLITFENADIRATLATERPQGGWHLEIVVRATFLAAHRLEDSVAAVHRVARVFGPIVATRLRRFDLAADYLGFPLEDDDARRIVTRARGRATFLADSKDVDEVTGLVCKPQIREYRGPSRVTGITAGSGGALMARLYAKSVELALPGREAKRVIEHALWRAHGWDGQQAVTRVEFQCRGALLDEIHLRDLAALPDRLDGVWQYCAKWLRLVEPTSSTRLKRSRIDPRWRAVLETIFRHTASPAVRNRSVRSAARAAQVLGSALSLSAAAGDLQEVDLGSTTDGELLDERGFAAAMTDTEAQEWVRARVRVVFEDCAAGTSGAFLNKYGPKGAVLVLAARINAAIARFSGVHPGEKGDP